MRRLGANSARATSMPSLRPWALFVLLLAPWGIRPVPAAPPSRVLRPEVADTLRTALDDPDLRYLLPEGWRVHSLTIGADRLEVRLGGPGDRCLLADLHPSPSSRKPDRPPACRSCEPGSAETILPEDLTPFLMALSGRVGPSDWQTVDPGPSDAPDDRSLSRPVLWVLLVASGLQGLLVSLLTLLALVRVRQPPPAGSPANGTNADAGSSGSGGRP